VNEGALSHWGLSRQKQTNKTYLNSRKREQGTAQISCVCIVSTFIRNGNILKVNVRSSGPGNSVGLATDYGLDGPGSNPVWDEIFARPDRPWSSPSLLYNGCRVFPRGTGGRGVVLTSHPHLVTKGSRKE